MAPRFGKRTFVEMQESDAKHDDAPEDAPEPDRSDDSSDDDSSDDWDQALVMAEASLIEWLNEAIYEFVLKSIANENPDMYMELVRVLVTVNSEEEEYLRMDTNETAFMCAMNEWMRNNRDASCVSLPPLPSECPAELIAALPQLVLDAVRRTHLHLVEIRAPW
jgi:hypothetical protein